MYQESFDQQSVRRYVEAVRGILGRDPLREVAGRAAARLPGPGEPTAKLSTALPAVDAAPGRSPGLSPGMPQPYLSRDPMVSLVQSAINGALADKAARDSAATGGGLWRKLAFTITELLHPGTFSPRDPDWVIKIAESMLGHLAKGNHPFNPRPAEYAISDTARLVVVGDWGTGLPRAQAVASHMAQAVSAALEDGREAHVIHLGDVYYSGLPGEYRQHALAYWPVTTDQARAGVTSWSLNGNHDMYSGGFGYFETLLGDPRFARQRSPDGRATSFFRLTSPSWEFVGLDTAWDSNVLTEGAVGVLRDPQADFVNSVATASRRKLGLLSHHQYVSAYDTADIGPELGAKLEPVLRDGRVTAWLWGHEHRCMGFNSTGGVAFPRCLGHGGVPVLQEHAADALIPPPGAWEYREYLVSENQRWARFGFAVLDLNGDRITVRYRNEEGTEVRTEEFA
jgi:hypothetical protein